MHTRIWKVGKIDCVPAVARCLWNNAKRLVPASCTIALCAVLQARIITTLQRAPTHIAVYISRTSTSLRSDCLLIRLHALTRLSAGNHVSSASHSATLLYRGEVHSTYVEIVLIFARCLSGLPFQESICVILYQVISMHSYPVFLTSSPNNTEIGIFRPFP